jgi:putative copper resistance protein D
VNSQRQRSLWLLLALVISVSTSALLIHFLHQDTTLELAGLPKVPTFTLWALPLSRLVTDMCAVLAVGSLTFVGIIFPLRNETLDSGSAPTISFSIYVIATWLVAAMIQSLLSMSNIFALPVSEVLTPNVIRSVLTQTGIGKIFLSQFIVLGIALLLASRISTSQQARTTLLVVLGANFIPALGGHSGLAKNHELAASTMAVHLLTLSIWVGTLIAMAMWFHKIAAGREVAMHRFSQLALFCYFAVAFSGVINAWLRLGGFTHILGSRYGQMVALKILLTIVIGFFAYMNRQRAIQAATEIQFPTRLILGEIILISVTLGVAVILARTGFPIQDSNYLPSLAEQILQVIVPEDLTFTLALTSFKPDALWLIIGLLLCIAYGRGVRALQGQWPVKNTVLFMGAILLFTYATSGGLGVYSHITFSAHMIQHMMLALAIPILLVFARPLTMAKRLQKENPEFLGPIDWYVWAYQSRFWILITKPMSLVAFSFVSYVGIYFTPLFGWLMSGHWGHIAMQMYLLTYGYALMWRVIGIDGATDGVTKNQIFLLLITEPIHIIFGVSLLLSNNIIGESIYLIIDRPYLQDLARDQKVGGVLSLVIGEVLIAWILMYLIRTKKQDPYPIDQLRQNSP